jgi:hypothetical protein
MKRSRPLLLRQVTPPRFQSTHSLYCEATNHVQNINGVRTELYRLLINHPSGLRYFKVWLTMSALFSKDNGNREMLYATGHLNMEKTFTVTVTFRRY